MRAGLTLAAEFSSDYNFGLHRHYKQFTDIKVNKGTGEFLKGYLYVAKNGKEIKSLYHFPAYNGKSATKEALAARPVERLERDVGKLRIGWNLAKNELELLLNGVNHEHLQKFIKSYEICRHDEQHKFTDKIRLDIDLCCHFSITI